MADQEVSRLLAAAAEAQRRGRADLAAEHLQAALKREPDHPAALNSLGVQALARQEPEAAAGFFARAAASDPKAAPLWINLAKAQRLLGDDEAERESLKRVLEIDQRHLMALIRMAELHERLGEHVEAMQKWAGVLALGHQIEQRPPELEALLAHAAAFVASQTASFADALDQGLAQERDALPTRDRRRFDACVDHALGRRAIYTNRCEGIHYPFLPADEFFDREHFPWLADLEARTDAIRAEFEGLLQSGQQGFKPYVRQDPGTPENLWSKLDNSLDWGAFFLWEYGQRYDDACARCPATAAALEAIPRASMPGRAPTAFFSLLRPRTRIPAHTGVTNVRAIVHLPLIVPDGCGFRVGGETREWRVGEAFAFDDTIEHEAWNDSQEVRAVLIFDVWNPHLSEDERRMLQSYFRIAEESRQQGGPSWRP